MATGIKLRQGIRKPVRSNGAHSSAPAEFAPGSLEAELSAIGKSAPAREWAKIPADYFANIDHYRLGAPKKK
jgi:hypothetical protein